MNPNDGDVNLNDLVDGTLAGPQWDAWLAAHPEAAAEVAIARRVRLLLERLRAAEIAVPDGFEARLMARIHEDRTLLELIDLGLMGLGRALLELLVNIHNNDKVGYTVSNCRRHAQSRGR